MRDCEDTVKCDEKHEAMVCQVMLSRSGKSAEGCVVSVVTKKSAQGRLSPLRNSLFCLKDIRRESHDCLWVNRTWSVLCGRVVHCMKILSTLIYEIYFVIKVTYRAQNVALWQGWVGRPHYFRRKGWKSSLEIELLSQPRFLPLLNVKCYRRVNRRPLLGRIQSQLNSFCSHLLTLVLRSLIFILWRRKR